MNLLNFIFNLGVLFAIYGFLWGLIEIGIWLLAGGQPRNLIQSYIIKLVKYFFLVDVTFLFCLNNEDISLIELNQMILAGAVLLTYFLGKLQKNQNRSMFVKMMGSNVPAIQRNFNMRYEIIVICISLGFFALFWFYPEYSMNPISNWFRDSIVNIENTPVFGFIFKIIGFFFLLSLIFKMLNSFNFLLSGGRIPNERQNPFEKPKDDDFDDFEELN